MRNRTSVAFLILTVASHKQLGAQSGPVSMYFEGTSQIQLPDGRILPGSAVLAKRTLNQKTSTITEQVISAGSRGRPATEFIVTAKVDGSKFTMTEASGAFDGDGTLQGPAWQWTGWTSISRLKEGGRVESIDSATATTLSVHKRVLAADGTEQVKTTEMFKVVDEARFVARRKELLPP
ncbi:MAG: hypothetical protein ABI852_21090 [Gemmatimonadaceae bacterium]